MALDYLIKPLESVQVHHYKQYLETIRGRMVTGGSSGKQLPRLSHRCCCDLVARRLQCRERQGPRLLFDQDVVGIEGGNRKDGDLVLRKRQEEGRKHSRHREREWPDQLEAHPSQFGLGLSRHAFSRAYD